MSAANTRVEGQNRFACVRASIRKSEEKNPNSEEKKC